MLRHRKQTNYPDIKTKDPKETAKTMDESFRANKQALKNIYDDLVDINDALPENAQVVYFGPSGTDGTWRIIPSGNDLSVQRREGGVWVEKGLFTA